MVARIKMCLFNSCKNLIPLILTNFFWSYCFCKNIENNIKYYTFQWKYILVSLNCGPDCFF